MRRVAFRPFLFLTFGSGYISSERSEPPSSSSVKQKFLRLWQSIVAFVLYVANKLTLIVKIILGNLSFIVLRKIFLWDAEILRLIFKNPKRVIVRFVAFRRQL